MPYKHTLHFENSTIKSHEFLPFSSEINSKPKKELLQEVNELIDSVPIVVGENKSDFKLYFSPSNFNAVKSKIINGKYRGYEIFVDKRLPNDLFFIK